MGAIRKGKMSRIALGLAVAITMVLGLMPGAGVGHALADDSGTGRFAAAEMQAADVTYPLWVGEMQVTSTNLQGQGWSFTPAANGNPATLTLSGYSYTGPGHMETLQDYDGEWDYYRHAPIFWNADSALVVELAGESSIVVTADSADKSSIVANADSADGSASEDGTADEEDEDPTHRYCGIFCAGNLTVRGTGSLDRKSVV